jgi:hypothetical protein
MFGIMKLIAVVLMVLILGAMASEARMPQFGDKVQIAVDGTLSSYIYRGTVTGMDQGLLCLNCTQVLVAYGDSPDNTTTPFDMCIGVGSIRNLSWLP